MKKHLANIVSSTRVIAAIVLFFFAEITSVFLAIYMYCGFSDLIDGPIARKTNSMSITGARLDTIGDVLTYLALTKILLFNSLIPIWAIIWFLVTIVLFLVAGFISKIRFKKFNIVHSLFGKILGGSIFIIPIAFRIINSQIYVGIICLISTIASIETIFIQSKAKKVDTTAITVKQLEE